MAKVGFIGVGNMGGPMARNLITAGHSLKVFDLSEEAVNFLVQSGAERAASVQDAAKGVDYVVTMLPVGANVCEVFLGDGVIGAAAQARCLSTVRPSMSRVRSPCTRRQRKPGFR